MKKFLLILIILGLISPIIGTVIEIKDPLGVESFEELIARIINILFTISLYVAPVMIIIGAFYFLIPDEKAQNIETGKKIILYTIIGFVIIILANGMIALLREAFEIN